MIDELDDFNAHIWQAETLVKMNSVPDHILVRSRWVMANKDDAADPNVCARLVRCEMNKRGETNDAFYASTPPVEAKMMLFSQFASERVRKNSPLWLSFVDVRKTYFNGKPTRNLYMQFPKELGLGPNLVAKLVRCAYGCRDAGHIWELCYTSALESIGFITGAASPCCFFHPTLDVNVVVHGDDFTAMGTDKDLDHYEKDLARHFEFKIRGRIGKGVDGPNNIRILNRCLKLTKDGLIYESDPRHVDLLLHAFNLVSSPGVGTPGTKEPDFEGEAIKSPDVDAIQMTSAFCDESATRHEGKEEKMAAPGTKNGKVRALYGARVKINDAMNSTHEIPPFSHCDYSKWIQTHSRPCRSLHWEMCL